MASLTVLKINVRQSAFIPYGYEYGISENFTGNFNILNALKTLFNINHTIPRDADLLSLSQACLCARACACKVLKRFLNRSQVYRNLASTEQKPSFWGPFESKSLS